MLADDAGTDGHRLRRVEPLAQATRELARLGSGADLLGRGTHRNGQPALGHPRRALARCCAGLRQADLTDRVGVLGRLPHAPVGGTALGRDACTSSAAGTRSKSPAELVSRLRAAPVSADPIADKVLEATVRSSLAPVIPLDAQITGLERQLAGTLASSPRRAAQDPAAGAIVSVAGRFAEIVPLLERCEIPEQVAAMCGAAPVTKASGMSSSVGFRYSANKPARVRQHQASSTSRGTAPLARRAHASSTARGGRHPHAVRILARGGSASSGRAGRPTPDVADRQLLHGDLLGKHDGLAGQWSSSMTAPTTGAGLRMVPEARATGARVTSPEAQYQGQVTHTGRQHPMRDVPFRRSVAGRCRGERDLSPRRRISQRTPDAPVPPEVVATKCFPPCWPPRTPSWASGGRRVQGGSAWRGSGAGGTRRGPTAGPGCSPRPRVGPPRPAQPGSGTTS